jgi:predicted PurR-regulated permease PerM
LITQAFPKVRFGPLLAATVLTVLLLWLFLETSHTILLLFLAILISLYLGAVGDFIAARTPVPPAVAFWLGVVLTLAALVGLFWLLVPPVVQQTRTLFDVLPQYINSWEEALKRAADRYPALEPLIEGGGRGGGGFVGALYEQVRGLFADAAGRVVGVLHAAISIFSVAIMALYLARGPGAYREWLIAFFPPIHRDLVRDVLGEVSMSLRKWIVGQLIGMIILAGLTAIGLKLLAVPFWLPFGIFTGAVAIVPFFGTLVSTLLPALFVLGGPGFHGLGPGTHALLVVLLGAVIHIIESNLVMPKINQKQTSLPPVLTIMSVLIVGQLLGPLGLLVAVPTVVIVMVVVRRILVNRLYEGLGFRRSVRDRSLILRVPVPEGGVLTPDGPPLDPITILERAQARRIA